MCLTTEVSSLFHWHFPGHGMRAHIIVQGSSGGITGVRRLFMSIEVTTFHPGCWEDRPDR